MSDLTITNAGVSVEKKTGGEVLSNNKKLNQMKVDVIDVDPTNTDQACSNAEVIFQQAEIVNAVSVKGGACILQSITLLDDDDEGKAMDLIFTDTSLELDDSADGTAIDLSDANAGSILGVIRISDYMDGVNWQLAHKENCGLVLKAAAGSTSIYVSGVNRSGGAVTYNTTTDLHLKFGVVKD